MQSRLPRLFVVLICGVLCFPVSVRANGWEHAAVPFEALLVALEFEHAETRRRAAPNRIPDIASDDAIDRVKHL